MATSSYKWSKGLLVLFFLIHAQAFSTPRIPKLAILHPFFVSVTEIEYNAQAKTLEISCKMFTDDLEKALSKAFRVPVDMVHPKDAAVLDQQLARYLYPQLLIMVDGKAVVLKMIGHEIEAQSTYCYFEVAGVATAPKKIGAINKILQEMNSNQINIMHVTVLGNRKSTKLDFPATDAIFQF